MGTLLTLLRGFPMTWSCLSTGASMGVRVRCPAFPGFEEGKATLCPLPSADAFGPRCNAFFPSPPWDFYELQLFRSRSSNTGSPSFSVGVALSPSAPPEGLLWGPGGFSLFPFLFSRRLFFPAIFVIR